MTALFVTTTAERGLSYIGREFFYANEIKLLPLQTGSL